MVGRIVAGISLLLYGVCTTAALAAGAVPLTVPPGFEATLYADDALATDITAMTIDHRGRVVVSGPGYVKILHDDDRVGPADRTTLFSSHPKTGAQGMVLEASESGSRLIYTGDDGLRVLYDNNGDDVVDAGPQEIVKIGTSEYGAHGVCRGPDGDFYVACGNDSITSVQRDATTSGIKLKGDTPIVSPRGGKILRTSLRQLGVIERMTSIPLETFASGFRNPYDLDFNAAGNLFTVEGDNERDFGLPWYAPTRLFDVAQAREHGWILPERDQGWSRPGYFSDSVEPGADLGRGAPTGLVAYRHRQFPELFRGGLFTADWSLGRVDFLPLTARGASYSAKREAFLEFIGDIGLAPVDLAVGPAGDLFIACGGRGTPGAVYRVRYVGRLETEPPPMPAGAESSLLTTVLRADQPLAAWSRADWIPKALRLGKQAFVDAIADPSHTVAEQIRAVEILAELFEQIQAAEVQKAVALKRPLLSARIVWLLERQRSGIGWRDVAVELTYDADPHVQLAAWTAVARSRFMVAAFWMKPPNWRCTTDPTLDPRIRSVVVQLVREIPPPQITIGGDADDNTVLQRTAYDRIKEESLHDGRLEFAPIGDTSLQLRQIRRIQQHGGDVLLGDVRPEVQMGYRGKSPPSATTGSNVREAVKRLAAAFPTGNPDVDRELARTFVLCGYSTPDLFESILQKWTLESSPVEDVHYLIVASLMREFRSAEDTRRIAEALVLLDDKLARRNLQPERNWPVRIAELFVALVALDARLPDAVVSHRKFGRPRHALFVPYLAKSLRVRAADRIYATVVKLSEEEVAWNVELIEVFTQSSEPKVLDLLRGLWKEPGLRDAIFPALAEAGEAVDRPRFIDALRSSQPEVVARAALILRRTASLIAGEHDLAAAVQGLRQMCTMPEAVVARENLTTLLSLWGDQPFDTKEPTPKAAVFHIAALRDAYQPVFLWFALNHYQASAAAGAPGGVNPASWRKQLLKVDWDEGDVDRGRALFEKKLCVRCHTGDSKLGPDLDLAVEKYSRSELFATVFEPSRFVPPRYRPTTVELRDGRSYTGIPVYESAATVLLQTGVDRVVRIRGNEVRAKRTTTQSIMPLGMLGDFRETDFADLYAYLRTLSPH